MLVKGAFVMVLAQVLLVIEAFWTAGIAATTTSTSSELETDDEARILGALEDVQKSVCLSQIPPKFSEVKQGEEASP